MSLRCAISLILLATLPLAAQTQPAQQPNPNRPTLFLVGDLPIPAEGTFDPNMLKVVESPTKGQTTRTFNNSGAWDQLTAQMKSGDFVLIGFKPNTNATPSKLGSDMTAAATQTFDSAGDSTFDYMDPDTHKLEHIHSYAWYLRKFIVDTINHGANPMLAYPPMPPDPANRFPDNPKLAYPAWIIKALTVEQHIPYVNLTIQTYRPALEALKPNPLAPYLSRKKY